MIICTLASAINFGVAWILLAVGKKYNSITLEADRHHLLTDVWTSLAVLGGVGVVAVTDWERLDPIVALLQSLPTLSGRDTGWCSGRSP